MKHCCCRSALLLGERRSECESALLVLSSLPLPFALFCFTSAFLDLVWEVHVEVWVCIPGCFIRDSLAGPNADRGLLLRDEVYIWPLSMFPWEYSHTCTHRHLWFWTDTLGAVTLQPGGLCTSGNLYNSSVSERKVTMGSLELSACS